MNGTTAGIGGDKSRAFGLPPTVNATSYCRLDKNFRNREGKIIGRMDGAWLRDGTGKLVARYDKSDDRTRDRSGRIVGNGDQRLRKLGKG
jgi:hypothetical protein